MSTYEFNQVMKYIKPKLQKDEVSLEMLIDDLDLNLAEEKVLNVLRYLKDNGKIIETNDGILKWR